LTCKNICLDFPARRLTGKFGSLYDDNFRCFTCDKFISPAGAEKNEKNILVCKCCGMKLRSRCRERKLEPIQTTS